MTPFEILKSKFLLMKVKFINEYNRLLPQYKSKQNLLRNMTTNEFHSQIVYLNSVILKIKILENALEEAERNGATTLRLLNTIDANVVNKSINVTTTILHKISKDKHKPEDISVKRLHYSDALARSAHETALLKEHLKGQLAERDRLIAFVKEYFLQSIRK